MEEAIKQVDFGGVRARFTGDGNDPYFVHLQGFISDHPELLHYGRRHFASDNVVFDVGANIGASSILLAKLCPRGHVYAFEPVPANVAYLRRNLELNNISNCTVILAAVGSESGEIDICLGGSGSHIASEAHMDLANRPVAKVPVLTLDAFAAEHPGLHVDFIKLDVEGYEPAVLAGGANLIERDRPPILMEFNSWCLSFAHGFNPFAFAHALWRAFDVRTVNRNGDLSPAAEGSATKFLHDNHVHHGMVDDLLIQLKAGTSLPSLSEMTESKETRRLRAELATAQLALATAGRGAA